MLIGSCWNIYTWKCMIEVDDAKLHCSGWVWTWHTIEVICWWAVITLEWLLSPTLTKPHHKCVFDQDYNLSAYWKSLNSHHHKCVHFNCQRFDVSQKMGYFQHIIAFATSIKCPHGINTILYHNQQSVHVNKMIDVSETDGKSPICCFCSLRQISQWDKYNFYL